MKIDLQHEKPGAYGKPGLGVVQPASAWQPETLPRQLVPGLGDGLVELGMFVEDVFALFGHPSAFFPSLELAALAKKNGEPIDTSFLVFGPTPDANFVEIEFDKPISESGVPMEGARVRSIHYAGKVISGEDHKPLSRDSAHKEFGAPDRSGEHTGAGGRRKSWDFFNSGLQIVYLDDNTIEKVVICQAVPSRPALQAVPSRPVLQDPKAEPKTSASAVSNAPP
jgi:hypothetical protein